MFPSVTLLEMILTRTKRESRAVMVLTQQHTTKCTREYDCQLKTHWTFMETNCCNKPTNSQDYRDFGIVEITFT